MSSVTDKVLAQSKALEGVVVVVVDISSRRPGAGKKI
jgi:hypothetical protein